VLTMRNYTI